jgi:hypothetical protein
VANVVFDAERADPGAKFRDPLCDQRVDVVCSCFSGNQPKISGQGPKEVIARFAESIQPDLRTFPLEGFRETRRVHDTAARLRRVRENTDGEHW